MTAVQCTESRACSPDKAADTIPPTTAGSLALAPWQLYNVRTHAHMFIHTDTSTARVCTCSSNSAAQSSHGTHAPVYAHAHGLRGLRVMNRGLGDYGL